MGKPNLRSGRNPQVAAAGDRSGAAGADAGNGGDGRHGAAVELVEHLLHARLVGEPVGAALEVAEERDVGAGGEGAPARAGEDQRAHGPVGGEAFADLAEPVVHGEGERVVCRRPVERNDADRAHHLVDQLVAGGFVLHRACAPFGVVPAGGAPR